MKNRRLTTILTALAAAGYAVEGAIVVRVPQPDQSWHASGYAVEAAFVVALAASLPPLGTLRHSSSRVSGIAVWITRAGFAAMLVSAVPSLVAGGNELGPLFLLGVLASIVGLATLSAGAIRHRPGSWWTTPTIAAGLVLSIALGDNGGGILLGIAWAATGLALRNRDSDNSAVETPVRATA
jgi:hypothetical protein